MGAQSQSPDGMDGGGRTELAFVRDRFAEQYLQIGTIASTVETEPAKEAVAS